MSSKASGGLSRHFTNRLHRASNSDINRNGSISIRSKISGPVELIHTTNMLSYNAPDIGPRSASSTTTMSSRSDEDSDMTAASSVASSPPTSPDVAESADRKPSPEPNHLSCYFNPPAQQTTTIVPAKKAPAPIIPKRAASHTKKNSEIIVKQRSVARFSNQSTMSTSTKASNTFSRASTTSTAPSHASLHVSQAPKLSPPVPSTPVSAPRVSPPAPIQSRRKESYEKNPFGQELAQVTEIAEEFGVKEKFHATDDEEKYMRDRGLFKFRAEDYISDIQGLVAHLFADSGPAATAPTVWI